VKPQEEQEKNTTQTSKPSKVNSLKTLRRISEKLVPFLVMLLLLPVLVLLGFGAYAIYRLGFLFDFVGLLLACTALAAIPSLWVKHRVKKQQSAVAQIGDNLVTGSEDWSDYDRVVWDKLNVSIKDLLQQDVRWEALRPHALSIVREAAGEYHTKKHGEWVFTVPELLRMTEEVSRRYRILLKQHVPLIENINLSTMRLVYDHRDKQQTAQDIWNVYRLVRLFTPAGVIAEARSQIMSYLFRDLKDEVQMTLKRAFLQEVASVAIDLYSGRFKVDDESIGASRSYQADQQRLAAPPEPLRVCFLGQVSAGKSSIINALIGRSAAEVSQLPSTDQVRIYQLLLSGEAALSLVDLPGLDGEAATDELLFTEIKQCDVLVWVLKANQPARALDSAFREHLDAWYTQTKNRARKRPVTISVLNQVDRLPPVNEWSPPYDVDTDTSPKVKTIRDALAYNEALLSFKTLIPLSVSADKPHFNLSALEALLDKYYEEGLQTQLNRLRLEAAEAFSVQDQFKRAYRMGQSLFKASKG